MIILMKMQPKFIENLLKKNELLNATQKILNILKYHQEFFVQIHVFSSKN